MRRFLSNLVIVVTVSVVMLLVRYRWPEHWHHLMIFYAVLLGMLIAWALVHHRLRRK